MGVEAERYTNRGKGLVLADQGLVDKLHTLFEQKVEWKNYELNAELGWQFSQAIYYLRKRYAKQGGRYEVHTFRLPHRQFVFIREDHQQEA